MTTDPHKSGIAEAVEAAGGQVKMAEDLGVTQQAGSQWVIQGYAPLRRAPELEALYGIPRARLISPRVANLVDLPTEEGEL